MGGGIVVTDDEKVLADLKLPIGWLMSDMPADKVRLETATLFSAMKTLGCTNPQPFMQMSFLSLSAILELKLTDKGYFSINEGQRASAAFQLDFTLKIDGLKCHGGVHGYLL